MPLPLGVRTALATIALSSILIGGMAAPAGARSVLDRQLRDRTALLERIEEIRVHRRLTTAQLIRAVERHSRTLRIDPGIEAERDHRVTTRLLRQIKRERWEAAIRIARLDRFTVRRVRALRRQRAQISAWIDQWAVLRTCPVAGQVDVADNYGIIREMPGTPRHVHRGSDIGAPTGTPIVAPFDGVAVASTGDLGGLEVRVYGAGGYAYNAHLSGYGRTGEVRAGAVIGYVGSTGNALSPHVHFEWHPSDGLAVDPYPYLALVC